MTVPMRPLREVATFIRGITFKPEDVISLADGGAVACFRTKNVQAELDVTDVWGVPAKFVKNQNQMLRQGDILVSSANSWHLVGKCSWVPQLSWAATLGGFIAALRAKEEAVFPRYLYHWFKREETQAKVRSCARQTTNIANLSLDRCLAIEIPLPPLDEQRRIAAILDQADALRRKRREAVNKTRELLRSIYLTMFGDPLTNPRKWPVKLLGEVGELERGISKHRPRNDPALLGGPYPLVQTGDVANADGVISTFTATYSERGLQQSRLWPKGTLCITIAANIGKAAQLGMDACFPDSIVGFSPGPSTNSAYVLGWLGAIQKRLEEAAPESAQKNINLAILRALPIPMPNLDLQNEFEEITKETRRSIEVQNLHTKELQELFLSLQHRAFRGEL